MLKEKWDLSELHQTIVKYPTTNKIPEQQDRIYLFFLWCKGHFRETIPLHLYFLRFKVCIFILFLYFVI
jgi:hypothetical protein